jgi:hypothetical protein
MTPDRSRTTRGAPRAARYLRFQLPGCEEATVDLKNADEINFEDAEPIRSFTYARDQANTPGLYWSATGQKHLAYESYLESRWLLLFDQDPTVTGIATQPFHLVVIDPHGGSWERFPDFFLRRRDGSATVIDVKRRQDLDDPEVTRAMSRTRLVCAEIGWAHKVVTEPDRQLLINLEWLAGYRRPFDDHGLTPRLLHLGRNPVSVDEITAATDQPELARAVLFHLIWHNRMRTELDKPLRNNTYVRAANGKGDIG